jgi:acyl-CoA synthetase (NDP forming)
VEMDERFKNMDYLFKPRSIAFIGASEAMGKWGFIVFNNILRGGWEGRLYPVNPGRESVLGLKAYPSVRDIPDEVDLAVFTVPARNMEHAIDECVAKRVKVGLVITAGFKEMGGEYANLESDLVAMARAGGMLLVGPNCQGIICPKERLYSWMPNSFFPRGGTVGMASQSGNILNIFINCVINSGLGVARSVSTGNEADLKMVDYYEYLADAPDVDVILSYIEGLVDGRDFFERTRGITLKKPVIILKGGRTQSGESAARSHTGAMAVSDDLFNALCNQLGIVSARTAEEAAYLAASFINRPLPRGNRVAIITGGGGLGVVAADACSDESLDIVRLSQGTLDKLSGLLPDWWVPGNPIDLVAGLRFDTIGPILEILIGSGEVDSIMFLFIGPPRLRYGVVPRKEDRGVEPPNIFKMLSQNFGAYSEGIYKISHDTNIPIYTVMNLTDDEGVPLSELQGEKAMAIYPTIELACRALGEMTRYYRYRTKLVQ